MKNDNQYFRFEPVPNKADTYYIIAKITDQKNNNLYVGTEKDAYKQESKIALTSKKQSGLLGLRMMYPKISENSRFPAEIPIK